jgi:hypothetical protein
MAGKEYTIRGAHVRGGTGVHHPGMLILESHLVERGDEASLIPHRSQLGDLKWCKLKVVGGCTSANAVWA